MNFDTKERTVENYLQRDIFLGLNDIDNIISTSVFKLGYRPNAINNNILNAYEHYCHKLLKDEKKNGFQEELPRQSIDDYKLQIKDETIKKQNRYEELITDKNYKNCNDLSEFYNELTVEELLYLGY